MDTRVCLTPAATAPVGAANRSIAMTDAGEESRRQAIRLALHSGAANGAGAVASAAAVLDLWHQTARQLEPVIGARGVEVLFGRALHLTARHFSWLPTSAHGNSAVSLEALRACLATRSATEASEAGETLLLTFSALLVGLVGDALTSRLLGASWAPNEPPTQAQRPM